MARLLSPANLDEPGCLDIGCGTGLNTEAITARGYSVIGIDLSVDQLRVAASRNRRLVRGDTRQLPLADASIPAVIMTFTHTDMDDLLIAVGEAARVSRHGGRMIYLGVHPAHVGAFVDRRTETIDEEVRITGR